MLTLRYYEADKSLEIGDVSRNEIGDSGSKIMSSTSSQKFF